MPNSKSSRKKLELAKRREWVADLHLQGMTQLAIAERLAISQASVSSDLAQVSQAWLESATADVGLERLRELKKLDRLEQEAWQSYGESKKPAQSADITGTGEGNNTRKRIRNQHGDPRFLMVINHSILQRRALLGLDAPTRIAPTMPDGVTPYTSASLPVIDQLSDEDFRRVQEAQAILAQASGKEEAR